MSKLIGFDYGASFNTFQTTTSATTSSTSMTALGSVFVPGGNFSQGNAVRCQTYFDKTGTANGFDINLYWNTVPNLSSGSPQLVGVFSATTTAAQYLPFYRVLMINDTTGSNTIIYNTTYIASTSDLNPATLAVQSASIDWTQDGYLVCAGRVLNASDVINFRWAKVLNG